MVVRGGDLSEQEIRRDALRSHRRFGEYGISVLGAPSELALEEIARGVLVRFEVLTILSVGVLRGRADRERERDHPPVVVMARF